MFSHEENLVRRLREEIFTRDNRFHIEAYLFVAHAMHYADEWRAIHKPFLDEEEVSEETRHLTGAEFCDVLRHYAWRQYGLLAKAVLNSWGITKTGDFGDIVFHLIRIKELKKSKRDKKSDFDDVFDFEKALVEEYAIETKDIL